MRSGSCLKTVQQRKGGERGGMEVVRLMVVKLGEGYMGFFF